MFTLYILIKCLHIVAATIWFGGNFIIALLHLRAARSGDWEAVTTLGRQGGFVGGAVMAPAAAVALITGIVLTVQGGFRFDMVWIVWGLVGLILSWFVLSATLIRKAGIELGRAAQEGGPADPRVAGLHRRMMRLTFLNLAVLLSVLVVMVAKPV
ncbi:MAG: DUF2269 family protein [Rhodothermales bacterium]